MPCPHCGGATTAGARFCPSCGQSLALAPATAAEDVTVAPAQARSASKADHKSASSSSGWLSSSDSISHGRFAPGAILDGRYRIIGLLGKGGMGEVYRADDLRLGQPVALKFLPDTVASDPARLAQFHNEVRTARQISHPNVCRVHDIGEVDGCLFLSMELVDGEDLGSSLRRIGRFPEDKATDIARQLCAGLAAAHEKGVLHRDLKPANVMLDGSGKVRVMDFGLAAIGAVEDIRAGTPAYMAPEQLSGREVTARSDIYALGLVLYELFTGRRTFAAATLNELVEQHQSGLVTPPSAIVPAIDLAIERAILRCLDTDQARRPSTPLAVSAALPGGDPLAAALAAGETPSPEMVAAAGEGTGLSHRVAVPVFVAAIAGMAAVYVMTLNSSALERMQPELTSEVLAQKAREAIRQLGYSERAADEAYGFEWDDAVLDYAREHSESLGWNDVFTSRPSALLFWYRRSLEPMSGVAFHHDLLTPGIVDRVDPPPVESGMIQLTFDQRGLLTSFEAIPPQVDEAPAAPQPLDWRPLLALAGFDSSALQTAEPQWNWLATADARAAWTGEWPARHQPLRLEAAALRGRPVAFQAIGPWTRPWRTPQPTSGGEAVFITAIVALSLSIVIGGAVLARRNLREGRGDRAGALALGLAAVVVLWALWICQVHVSASVGMVGNLLIAIVTTVFYGVLFWALYLALEPFVRRYWPQALVSWTTLLGGRVRDPIVGRDVLFGVILGVLIALLVRGTYFVNDEPARPPTELLMGARSASAELLMQTIYATRTGLFTFFLIFLFRLLLRNQWLGALVFVSIMAALNALTSNLPWFDAASTFMYFAMFAVAVLRWGLTTLAVGVLIADLLLVAPATTSLSAWYLGEMTLVLAIPLALAAWAFLTSISSASRALARS
jgi:hypothetical protein